jgi:hypothetical protein
MSAVNFYWSANNNTELFYSKNNLIICDLGSVTLGHHIRYKHGSTLLVSPAFTAYNLHFFTLKNLQKNGYQDQEKRFASKFVFSSFAKKARLQPDLVDKTVVEHMFNFFWPSRFKVFCKKNISSQQDLIIFWARVARFFLVQYTKTGNIDQFTTKYTKCP